MCYCLCDYRMVIFGVYETFRFFMKKTLIKRADGSMSQRGMWDNIRDAKGSGKKPTKEMLKQERKIKRKAK